MSRQHDSSPFSASGAHKSLALVSIVVVRPPLLCLFALESLLTPCFVLTVLLFADGGDQERGKGGTEEDGRGWAVRGEEGRGGYYREQSHRAHTARFLLSLGPLD